MAGVDVESRGVPAKDGSRGSNNFSSSSSFAIDEGEAQWTSWLVPMFVVAGIAVFVVTMYVNDCPEHHPAGGCVAKFLGRLSFEPLKQNPLFGPSDSTLIKLGALDWDRVVHRHQGWRLVTCAWLHAGVIHLAVNMLCLILIGVRLEQQFGFVRIGIIFLLSGFGGSVLSGLFIQNFITVGASGGLFGLLGAMLSELFTNWTLYTNKAAALVTLAFVIAVNLAIGILPHVNNFAHIGGFLTGVPSRLYFAPPSSISMVRPSRSSSRCSCQIQVQSLSVCVVASFLAAATCRIHCSTGDAISRKECQ
ncbi:hypothetical protein NL676_016405 [Syzygium grande]|nr:hypothetical protein NL676_016405 [Syzygium grande]